MFLEQAWSETKGSLVRMYDTAKLEFLNIVTTWLLDVLRETPDQPSLIPVLCDLEYFLLITITILQSCVQYPQCTIAFHQVSTTGFLKLTSKFLALLN